MSKWIRSIVRQTATDNLFSADKQERMIARIQQLAMLRSRPAVPPFATASEESREPSRSAVHLGVPLSRQS
jgi:hypothetical protein